MADIIRAIQSKIDELKESRVTNESDGSSGILEMLSKIPTFLSMGPKGTMKRWRVCVIVLGSKRNNTHRYYPG